MQTDAFRVALDELIALGRGGTVAVMCAEAVPWRCHRSLIADALLARGIRVEEVVGTDTVRDHGLTPFAHVEGDRVLYPVYDVRPLTRKGDGGRCHSASRGAGQVARCRCCREVDLSRAVLARLSAGYLMALADSGLSKVPGLVAIDIADYGRRYMISDRPSAWLLELALHLANSVLLVLFWAMLIEPNVHGHGPWSDSPGVKRSPSRSPVSLVAPRSSLGFMGWRLVARASR